MTHLLNLLGHFPFGCGAAQLCSSIKEYHDCPSLMHMDDLSPEIFDSPRIQVCNCICVCMCVVCVCDVCVCVCVCVYCVYVEDCVCLHVSPIVLWVNTSN